MNETKEETLVEIEGLVRRYGTLTALNGVTLSVPKGKVFGLLGANGAGKTTMIKHIMGLLKPQQGSVQVFGRQPAEDPVEVLSRIGYLSEVNDLPEWMRVIDLIEYTKAFYPNWNDEYARELHGSFELQDKKKVKTMSKGQRARLGLLLALSHRPDLLVLDEPSSGLDPIVRADIVRAIIRAIGDEGRTVLFSSHLLDEVERVADYIAIIESGNIVRCGTLDAIKHGFHTVGVRLSKATEETPTINGATSWRGSGMNWLAMVEGDVDEFRYAVDQAGAEVVDLSTPSLNEIFVSLVGNEHPSMES